MPGTQSGQEKKANEVTDMQAAFALHIFQSDYES